MIQSLKVRLIYDRCLFNELLIYHNSDAILQGYNELNDLLFYQVPLLNMLTKYQFLIAFQRTIIYHHFLLLLQHVIYQIVRSKYQKRPISIEKYQGVLTQLIFIYQSETQSVDVGIVYCLLFSFNNTQ
ncbi:unnamed protein product [Paramecium octaurelia]|uniref:Uncharacterized protein n=1 Tax=Paramecium octaurelia TaxID=43137 RepID=A0A8S1U4G7_PAROT|nr:unnamed protein product [Paramecium octaurelia]